MPELTETNPTFKKCMVKKSKHYFKEVWRFILISALVVIAFILMSVGVMWFIDNITSPFVIGLLVYLLIVLLSAFMISLPNVTVITFLKSVIDVHLICIAVICVFIILVSCYVSISLIVATFIIYYVQNTYTTTVGENMGLWAVIFAITLPINLAFGDCLKCSVYAQLVLNKIMSLSENFRC